MQVPVDKKAFAKLNVLIVDDDALVQKLVKDVLVIIGFEKISVVSRADKAIEIIAGEQFDLIICDWRMPGMTGIEFVKHIRNLPICMNTFVSIIMLTGNAEEKNIVEARDIGVTEYLVKPFRAKDLCERIIEIIKRPREFVISEQYKGPSRRRRDGQKPEGVEERRKGRTTDFNTEKK